MSSTNLTPIASLAPYEKNVNCQFIVLEVAAPTRTRNNESLCQAVVADASGAVHLSVWDMDQKIIHPGDILRLTNGYTSLFHNALTLYSTKHSTLKRVGEFTMVFAEHPQMSHLQWVPKDPGNPADKTLVRLPPGQNPSLQPSSLVNPHAVRVYASSNNSSSSSNRQ